jgi:glutathione synthase/RimK-type ligase-like ATP-grasp enzyme
MVQPFLPAIAEEGELSFVFIDGEPSHALRKRPAQGDYRIQSLYGGRESAFDPAPSEIAAASAVLAALPVAPPVYARIDMLRDNDGALRLMEAELIEPYLYPEQGERVGEHLARALARRLAMKGP